LSAAPRGVDISRGDGHWVGRFKAFGGPCEVLAEIADVATACKVIDAVAGCAWRIERTFSRYRTDNVVARINASAGIPVEVDDEAASLLDYAALVHRLSDGMFDITTGVLRKVWSFDGGRRVPSQPEIDAVLPLVGWSKIEWNNPWITLRAGMQIDFGGIGKEYAVDRATRLASMATDAAVLVNFGGDLAVTRARDGNRPWRVGIEGVDGHAGPACRLVQLSSGALATSGDTYRYVESEGRRLSHILDPRTGWPMQSAPRSVTVAAPTCTNAGMLSTLAMLRGAGAETFLESEGARHWVQREARSDTPVPPRSG
jgi:thiamine biosynthesis lipoprotein